MINFNKKDNVADAIKSIIQQEEKTEIKYGKDEAEETPARKSIKAQGGEPIEQPKVGVVAKEEVEQIDELKKSTLGSYIKKASKDTAVHGFAIGDSIANKKWKTGAKAGDMAAKRISGIAKATDKLTKEESESVDEALKGNQHKIDKNHNNKIDAQDFKILRGKKTLKSFKEQYDENSILDQMISEVLSKDASAGKWIHDFVHSDNPKFAGKSKAKRKEMALGAYYAKQRNEEVEAIDEKLNQKKKTVDTLKGPVEVPAGTHNQHTDTKVELNSEGWNDMVKSATEKVKSGPKPSGGSGIKQGTRYGGGKQTSKPEQDEDDKKKVTESKRPEDDSVPFAPPYNTTSSPAFTKDKSGATHTPMSRAKHLAKLAMKRVKSDLGKK